MRMQYEHETRLNRSFLGDLRKVVQVSMAVQGDGSFLEAEDIPYTSILSEIIFSALLAGHRRDRQAVDFEVFDIVGWIDDADDGVLESIVESIVGAQYVEKSEDAKKKQSKQASRTRRRTGTRSLK